MPASLPTYDILVAIGILAGGGGVIPFTSRYRAWRRARRDLRRWLYGELAVKGISEGFASAPVQMVEMKSDIAAIKRDLSKLAVAVGDLIDIARSVDTNVKSVDKKVTGNGGDTNTVGDMMQRMAKSSGNWIEGLEAES